MDFKQGKMMEGGRFLRIKRDVKRRLSLLLVIVMIMAQPVFALGPQIEKDHWAYDTMISLVQDKIFSPMAMDWGLDEPISRQEFVRLINKAYGTNAQSEINFSDVAMSSPYYKDVAKAVASGMIKGYPDGSFKPMGSITRQEAAVVLSKMTRKQNVLTGVVNAYTDGMMVPDWSKEYMAWMIQNEYMTGYPDGSIGYDKPITYAEALALTSNVLGNRIVAETTDGGGQTIDGNVSVIEPNVTLKNMVINGDLVIGGQVKEGDVTLDGVEIKGRLLVYGGGQNSIKLFRSVINQLVVSRFEAPVRIVSDDSSSVSDSVVETSSILEAPPSVSVFKSVIIQPTITNMSIDLSGAFDDVQVNDTPTLPTGTGQVQPERNLEINIPLGSVIRNLVVQQKAKIKGVGKVVKAALEKDDIEIDVDTDDLNFGQQVSRVKIGGQDRQANEQAKDAAKNAGNSNRPGGGTSGNTGNTGNTGGTSGGSGGSSGGGSNNDDDDDRNVIKRGSLVFSKTAVSVTEGEDVTLTVTRYNGASGEVSVNYTVTADTASASDVEGNTSGTITFASGETTKSVTVSTVDDSTIENDETFTVTLSGVSGGASLGTNKTITVTITDNDSTQNTSPGAISLTSSSYSVAEGDDVSISVERTMDETDGTVTVDYVVTNGTTDSSDFDGSTSGTITFADGEWDKIITVSTAEDTDVESDETFTVTISNPTGGATLGTLTSTEVTVTNDDTASSNPGTLAFSAETASVTEGSDVTLTVNRTGGSDGSVAVDYAVTNGTTDSADFDASTSGTITFADSETSKTITISTSADSDEESNETFTVALSNPTNSATLGTIDSTVVTINNDDNAGTIAFAAASVSVDEGQSTTITVNRSTGSDGEVTVSYSDNVTSGTAIKNTDYSFTPSTQELTFANGDIAETFTFAAATDGVTEGDEVVTLTLGTPSGGADLGTQTTIEVTIVDVKTAFDVTSVTSAGAIAIFAFSDDVNVSSTSNGAITVTSPSAASIEVEDVTAGDTGNEIKVIFNEDPYTGVAITLTEAVLSDESAQLTEQTWWYDGSKWTLYVPSE